MSEWKEYKLGELGTVITGKTPSSRNPEDWGGEMLFITPSDYCNFGKHANDSERKLSSVGIERLKNKVLPPKSILVTCIGSDMGKVVMNDVHCITNQQINAIIPHVNVDNDFLYYMLVSIYDTLRIYGGDGTAVPIVNKKDFENIRVELLVSIDEQHRIASILTSLDDKIDLLRCENATLEAMAETLFRHWFVVEAKEEWEEGKLGDIIDVKSGFAFKSSSFVDFGLYRLITIKAVQDGFLTLENADYISEIPDNIKDYCFLKEGDILLSLTGNVGRCCLVDRERLLLNQRVALLCAKDIKNWAYVYTLFRMQSMKNKLEEMAKGTAQPNLSPVELSNMQFEIPPTKLLEGFSEAATPLLKKTLSNNKQIQTLIQTRDGLLPRLMSNEINIRR